MLTQSWHLRIKSLIYYFLFEIKLSAQIIDVILSLFNLKKSPFDFISKNHFKIINDHNLAMRLFKKSITMVEIEIFSYCNRSCWFCPNAKYKRNSDNKYMDEETYLSILEQLKMCNYNKKISYSRYNEPLSDEIILKRIYQANCLLPGATLHFNTNGDYLSKKFLDKLNDAGLKSMNIQIYLNNSEHYNDNKIRYYMEEKIKSLDLSATVTSDLPNNHLWAEAQFKGISLRFCGRNFSTTGCNRGGTLQLSDKNIRTSPCLSPFYHIYIDYNGSVMPCCNVRSDIPEHKKYVIETLTKESDIFTTYTNSNYVAWRKSLISFNKKNGVCRDCNFVTFRATLPNRIITNNITSRI